MASKSAIGIMREQAIQKMSEASNTIAQELGVIGFELPMQERDADLLHANQLTALADFLEQIAVALDSPKASSTSKKSSKAEKVVEVETDTVEELG